MTTLRNVQALRAIAALLVVCVHMGNSQGFEARYLHAGSPLLAGFTNVGYTGVDLFFIISGFIMTVTTLGRRKLPTSADFFIRRVIRIYPPLWIITGLLFGVYLAHPELINSHSDYPPDIVASFLALPQRGSPLLLVAWSLAYEMYFYFVFTAALSFGRRSFVPVLALWAGATVAFNVAFGASDNPWLHTISNPICFEFLLGVVAGSIILKARVGRPMAWLCIGIAAYAVEAVYGFGTGWWRVLAAAPMAAVLLGAVGIEREAKIVLPAFLDRLGDASYATYLWHVPVLAVFGLAVSRAHLPPGAISGAAVVCAGIVIVEIVALVVYRFVERPLTDALKEALVSRRPVVAVERG
jgi:peptidoglycan/LPS O-acetylase OafA/YrhL